MKKYVKNKNVTTYKNNQFDLDASYAAANEIRKEKKMPTSIALDPTTIEKLKNLALKKGVPYQVLMRMFIIEGIKREGKKTA